MNSPTPPRSGDPSGLGPPQDAEVSPSVARRNPRANAFAWATALLEMDAESASGELRVGLRTVLVASGRIVHVSRGPGEPSLLSFIERARVVSPDAFARMRADAPDDERLPRDFESSDAVRDACRGLVVDRLVALARETPSSLVPTHRTVSTAEVSARATLPFDGVPTLPAVLDALTALAFDGPAEDVGVRAAASLYWVDAPLLVRAQRWSGLDARTGERVGSVLMRSPAAASRIAALVLSGFLRLQDQQPSTEVALVAVQFAWPTLNTQSVPGFENESPDVVQMLDEDPIPAVEVERAQQPTKEGEAASLVALGLLWHERYGALSEQIRFLREAASLTPLASGTLRLAAEACFASADSRVALAYAEAALGDSSTLSEWCAFLRVLRRVSGAHDAFELARSISNTWGELDDGEEPAVRAQIAELFAFVCLEYGADRDAARFLSSYAFRADRDAADMAFALAHELDPELVEPREAVRTTAARARKISPVWLDAASAARSPSVFVAPELGERADQAGLWLLCDTIEQTRYRLNGDVGSIHRRIQFLERAGAYAEAAIVLEMAPEETARGALDVIRLRELAKLDPTWTATLLEQARARGNRDAELMLSEYETHSENADIPIRSVLRRLQFACAQRRTARDGGEALHECFALVDELWDLAVADRENEVAQALLREVGVRGRVLLSEVSGVEVELFAALERHLRFELPYAENAMRGRLADELVRCAMRRDDAESAVHALALATTSEPPFLLASLQLLSRLGLEPAWIPAAAVAHVRRAAEAVYPAPQLMLALEVLEAEPVQAMSTADIWGRMLPSSSAPYSLLLERGLRETRPQLVRRAISELVQTERISIAVSGQIVMGLEYLAAAGSSGVAFDLGYEMFRLMGAEAMAPRTLCEWAYRSSDPRRIRMGSEAAIASTTESSERVALLLQLSDAASDSGDTVLEMRTRLRALAVTPIHVDNALRLAEIFSSGGEVVRALDVLELAVREGTDWPSRAVALRVLARLAVREPSQHMRAHALVEEFASAASVAAQHQAIDKHYSFWLDVAQAARIGFSPQESERLLTSMLRAERGSRLAVVPHLVETIAVDLNDPVRGYRFGLDACLRGGASPRLLEMLECLAVRLGSTGEIDAAYEELGRNALGPHGARALTLRRIRWLERISAKHEALRVAVLACEFEDGAGVILKHLEKLAYDTRAPETLANGLELLSTRASHPLIQRRLLFRAVDTWMVDVGDVQRAWRLLFGHWQKNPSREVEEKVFDIAAAFRQAAPPQEWQSALSFWVSSHEKSVSEAWNGDAEGAACMAIARIYATADVRFDLAESWVEKAEVGLRKEEDRETQVIDAWMQFASWVALEPEQRPRLQQAIGRVLTAAPEHAAALALAAKHGIRRSTLRPHGNSRETSTSMPPTAAKLRELTANYDLAKLLSARAQEDAERTAPPPAQTMEVGRKVESPEAPANLAASARPRPITTAPPDMKGTLLGYQNPAIARIVLQQQQRAERQLRAVEEAATSPDPRASDVVPARSRPSSSRSLRPPVVSIEDDAPITERWANAVVPVSLVPATRELPGLIRQLENEPSDTGLWLELAQSKSSMASHLARTVVALFSPVSFPADARPVLSPRRVRELCTSVRVETDESLSILALLCEFVLPRFVRLHPNMASLSAVGALGGNRVGPHTSSALGRALIAAEECQLMSDVRCFLVRTAEIRTQILATSPPSVVMGKHAPDDEVRLRHLLAARLEECRPEHILATMLTENDLHALMRATMAAFGPSSDEDVDKPSQKFAAELWSLVTPKAQRVLRESLLRAQDSFSAQRVQRKTRLRSAQVGLTLGSDLGFALSELAVSLDHDTTQFSSAEGFQKSVQETQEFRDILRFALRV